MLSVSGLQRMLVCFGAKAENLSISGQNDKAEEPSPLHIKQMEVLAASFFYFLSCCGKERNIQFDSAREINILKVKR